MNKYYKYEKRFYLDVDTILIGFKEDHMRISGTEPCQWSYPNKVIQKVEKV